MQIRPPLTPSKMALEDAHASFKVLEFRDSRSAGWKYSFGLRARREAAGRKTSAPGRSETSTQTGSQALSSRRRQARARQADGETGPEARPGTVRHEAKPQGQEHPEMQGDHAKPAQEHP